MSLSVATLNLHCGLDGRGVPYPVTGAIGALAADVVLVQENWRPTGADSLARRAALAGGYDHLAELDLVRTTPLRELKIIPGEVPGETGAWGLAVLSRFPVRAYATVALGAAPGDVAGTRMAQILEITDEDGAAIRVVNVHLTHRLTHGPAQLRRLLGALRNSATGGSGDRARGSALPTLIGGDFNMCRPAVYLARGYRPLVRGRTWPAHRPVAQLDHLLATSGVTLATQEVCPSVGSDHLPVRALLAVAGKQHAGPIADRVRG